MYKSREPRINSSSQKSVPSKEVFGGWKSRIFVGTFLVLKLISKYLGHWDSENIHPATKDSQIAPFFDLWKTSKNICIIFHSDYHS